MIERYVFIKLIDEHATPEGRLEVARRARSLAEIPGVRSLVVGTPADEACAAAWDISIAHRFDDLEAVSAYRKHADHRSFVDEFLAPRMAVVKGWNFEV